MIYEVAYLISQELMNFKEKLKERGWKNPAEIVSLHQETLERIQLQKDIQELKVKEEIEAQNHAKTKAAKLLNAEIINQLKKRESNPKNTEYFTEKEESEDEVIVESLENPLEIRIPSDQNLSKPIFSRYEMDFVEEEFLGKGSFGHVVEIRIMLVYFNFKLFVKARNRLDGRTYAIKKILVETDSFEDVNSGHWSRVLRERFVVRYYQAWIEHSAAQTSDLKNLEDSSQFDINIDWDNSDFSVDSHSSNSLSNSAFTLFIQMEYCEKRALKDAITEGEHVLIIGLNERDAWRLFRQIVEGLRHLHGQGMIHRDLKPTNIFLDSQGNCKIGDFGLATQNNISNEEKAGHITPGSENLTSGAVGTSFYIAPEIASGKRYSHKVDIYSLGIIFFELLHPDFKTGMERAQVLSGLRKETPIFPGSFVERPEMNNCGRRMISLLLNHDENLRPSAKAIARSEIMQEAFTTLRWDVGNLDFEDFDMDLFEDEKKSGNRNRAYVEDAIQVLTNPQSPYFSGLVTSLFKKGEGSIDPHIDFTFEYSKNYDWSLFSKMNQQGIVIPFLTPPIRFAINLQYVRNLCFKIIHKHGGVYFDTCTLLPSSSVLSGNTKGKTNLVKMVGEDGHIVSLPYDFTLGFARYVARNPISYLKRWTFNQVYRKNHAGAHPKSIIEADFDIVHSTGQNYVYDAEVINVALEILQNLGLKHGIIVRVSHGELISILFNVLQVPVSDRIIICSLINQFGSKWQILKNHLTQRFAFIKSWNILQTYLSIHGSFYECKAKVLEIFRNHQLIDKVFKYFEHFGSLFNGNHKVIFDASVFFNYHYYIDGIMFQMNLNSPGKEVLASGGRYDSLINQFKHPGLSNVYHVGGVGVNIAVSKLVMLLEDKRLSCWDVYVGSFGNVKLSELILICNDLWSHDIRADFAIENETIEELISYCQENNIHYLVIVKEKRIHNKIQISLKVRDIISKQETEVRPEDLVTFLHPFITSESGMKRAVRSRTFSSSTDDPEKPFHVNIIDTKSGKMKPSRKQFIIEKSIRSVQPLLDWLGVTNTPKEKPQIISIELRITIIKSICNHAKSFEDDLSFKREITDSFPQFREPLVLIRQALNEIRRNSQAKFVILYSYPDDAWEIFRF